MTRYIPPKNELEVPNKLSDEEFMSIITLAIQAIQEGEKLAKLRTDKNINPELLKPL